MKTLGITMGDPAGIGPEIIAMLLNDQEAKGQEKYIVIGSEKVMIKTIAQLGYDKEPLLQNVEIMDPYPELGDVIPGKLSGECGKAAYLYVEKAAKMALNDEIQGIVTAPLNKEAMHAGGYQYSGHTEILAEICGTKNYTMFLSGKGLNVFHVSTHVSLQEAINRVKTERIKTVIDLAYVTLRRIGIKDPKIAVCGLNPHAGEGGLFGDEESKEIIPAINLGKEEGKQIFGPEAPDTVFLNASKGKYDGVIAMYHDQGHIPLKMLGFDEGVNITVGLPIIRTSVDHGTAFSHAGKGTASYKSMVQALDMARRLISS